MAPSFDARLAVMRALLETLRSGHLNAPASPLLDQLSAAAQEAHGNALQFATALQSTQPGDWTCSTDAGSDDVEARILAAAVSCRACPHLRRTLAQPAWALLALRRIDCRRCLRTVSNPPADESDRCDWCGARGVSRFRAYTFQRGPLVVIGDACPACDAAFDLLRPAS